MIKPKLSLVAILSTTATLLVLTSVSSAAACPLREYRTSPEQSSQVSGTLSLVAALTLPGIALAVSLYGGSPTKVRFEPLHHSERRAAK